MKKNKLEETRLASQQKEELNDEELSAASGGYMESFEQKYSTGTRVEFWYDEPGRKGHSLDKGTVMGVGRCIDTTPGYLINGDKVGYIIVKEISIIKTL